MDFNKLNTHISTTITFFTRPIIDFFTIIAHLFSTIVHFPVLTVYYHFDNSQNPDTKDKNKQHTFKPSRPSLRCQAHLLAPTSQRSIQRLTKEPVSPSHANAPRNRSTSIEKITYIWQQNDKKQKRPVANTWYSACGFQWFASVCGS